MVGAARVARPRRAGKEWRVREDGPATPNDGLQRGWQTRVTQRAPAGPEPSDALDAPYLSGAVPRWSPAPARPPQPTRSGRAPRGYVSVTLFGISVGINVALLIGWIALIALASAGAFGARGPGPRSQASIQALGSPTATLTPAVSPTAGNGWLQVSPSSVQLGCGDSQTQQVVLQNTGPNKVSWLAQFSTSNDQAGVSVNPQNGRLSSGDSVTIQLQNTTQSSGNQGVIQFVPSNGNAGPPASLSYTTTACQ